MTDRTDVPGASRAPAGDAPGAVPAPLGSGAAGPGEASGVRGPAAELGRASEVAWAWLGRVPYEQGLAVQQGRAQSLLSGDDERQTVYALEHPPTIT
ncbi:MAG: hypothetical protein K6T30_09160, partial [Alicyclobacillus sp.]|nr:hypothetical protein [Alicyclobacillus sp.]